VSRSYPRGSDEFSRVLNFSDGVMAIAITLLVLNIDLPVPKSAVLARSANLTSLLGDVGPQLSAFLVSFVIVAYAWVGHHRLLAELRRIDQLFMQWNFAFLLLVVLVPLQSQLIGLYGDNADAVGLYSLGFALLFGWDLIGLRLAWSRRLIATRPCRRLRTHATLAKLLPVLMFLTSIPAAKLLGSGIASWLWLATWPLEAMLDKLLEITGDEPPGSAAESQTAAESMTSAEFRTAPESQSRPGAQSSAQM